MPAVFVPGNSLLPDDSLPWRFVLHSFVPSGDSSYTYTNGDHSESMGLLLGVDVTVTDSISTPQIFLTVDLTGCQFYRDSQTIGEGAGIDFAWRGQLPMYPNEHLNWTLTGTDSHCTVGLTAWGVVGPWFQSP